MLKFDLFGCAYCTHCTVTADAESSRLYTNVYDGLENVINIRIWTFTAKIWWWWYVVFRYVYTSELLSAPFGCWYQSYKHNLKIWGRVHFSIKVLCKGILIWKVPIHFSGIAGQWKFLGPACPLTVFPVFSLLGHPFGRGQSVFHPRTSFPFSA